jgi:hypothetical protein
LGKVWLDKAWQGESKIKEEIMVTAINPTTNGAKEQISYTIPYIATVRIRGVAPVLFHGWNNEAVQEKAKAAKNSKAKKTDDVESYVYRHENGNIGIKGTCLHGAIRETARYHQDPRSPRKSAMDLMKAAIIPLTEVADLGVANWDYIDRQRVVVQRAAITRERPAMRPGWQAEFELLVTLPEYVGPDYLLQIINEAGRICGVCDFRPTYGRFQVVHFETKEAIGK